MMRIIRQIGLLIAMAVTTPAVAQNLFAPVAEVNGSVITAYEQSQRATMLTLFRTPGDPAAQALDALINERLQMREAKRRGLTVTEEEIVAGETEFAQRAQLDRTQFLAALAQAGVARESLRDFVVAGLLWRKVVRDEFAGRVSISQAEVDRFIADARRERPGPRVLLTEIILPANTPQARATAERIAAELQNIRSVDAFSDAARRYSAAPTAPAGGRLDWMPIGNLPGNIAALVLPLAPGGVTPPVPLPNALAVFQLRGIQEAGAAPADRIEYATVALASPAEAARVAARVDTCDDLYGVVPDGGDRVARQTLAPAQIPAAVALDLARLDPGEAAISGTAGPTTLVMLCRRIADAGAEIGEEQARDQIVNRRVGRQADNLLAELRANAHIRRGAAARP